MSSVLKFAVEILKSANNEDTESYSGKYFPSVCSNILNRCIASVSIFAKHLNILVNKKIKLESVASGITNFVKKFKFVPVSILSRFSNQG